MRTAIVTTTIARPVVLERYLANAASFGHRDLTVIVIGDRKTPETVGSYLRELGAASGYAIDYWDVDRQRGYLRRLPELDRLLPYDSIQRRNLGYLVAVLSGHVRIVTIDDDNWPTEADYVGGHAIVGSSVGVASVSVEGGWFNSASLLAVTPDRPLYHRGFPVNRRATPATPTLGSVTSVRSVTARVAVNAGLWLGVPDADAMSHLDAPVTVTGFRPGAPTRLAVAAGTNLVFNTQNTAFHADLLPCMFLPPMGGRVGELVVGRYDDIWMSMLLKPIADHLGDLVCVGEPLTVQLRNDHDLFADALVELPAQRLTTRLVETLAGLRVSGSSYRTGYLGLVSDLRDAITSYPHEEAAYLAGLLDQMTDWAGIVLTVAATG
jgi:hypothetical protein